MSCFIGVLMAERRYNPPGIYESEPPPGPNDPTTPELPPDPPSDPELPGPTQGTHRGRW